MNKKRLIIIIATLIIILGGVATLQLNMNNQNNPKTLKLSSKTKFEGFNPIKMVFDGSFNVNSNVNVTLFENISGGVKKSAVTSYKYDTDNAVYTMKIKSDISFVDSNGNEKRKVTAYDFQNTIQAIAKKENNAPYRPIITVFENGYSILSGQKEYTEIGVKALSSDEIEFKLAKSSPAFLELLALPVFGALPVEFSQTDYGQKLENSWFAGEFYAAKYENNKEVELRKNPKYNLDSKSNFETITYQVINDNTTGVNAFKNNEIDVVQIQNIEEKNDLNKNSNYKTKTIDKNSIRFIAMNTQSQNFTKEQRVQLANSYNPSLCVDKVRGLSEKAIYGLIPEGFTADFNRDLRNENKNLINYTSEIPTIQNELKFVVDNSPESQKLANCIVGELKNKNIKITIVPVEYNNLYTTSEYDLKLVNIGADWQDPSSIIGYFQSPLIATGANVSKLNKSEFDNLYYQAEANKNQNDRFEQLKLLEKMIFDEGSIMPLYQSNEIVFYNNKVEYQRNKSQVIPVRNWK